ncbi:unnamed protein product, partial [Meganyctiphanes norvegica]
MEVDEDLEAGLLRQFNCMGTTDKEVLIKELQGLVGSHLNEHSARFYLDMTDWNLQAAVCAYFDLQSANKLPQMTFVKDITIGEGESVPPNTRFVKTWRIQNPGSEGWPSGCRLLYAGGELLNAPTMVSVQPIPAGETSDISIEMLSPTETGIYSSKWRMCTATGNYFGECLHMTDISFEFGSLLTIIINLVVLGAVGALDTAMTAILNISPHLTLSPSKTRTSDRL